MIDAQRSEGPGSMAPRLQGQIRDDRARRADPASGVADERRTEPDAFSVGADQREMPGFHGQRAPTSRPQPDGIGAACSDDKGKRARARSGYEQPQRASALGCGGAEYRQEHKAQQQKKRGQQ